MLGLLSSFFGYPGKGSMTLSAVTAHTTRNYFCWGSAMVVYELSIANAMKVLQARIYKSVNTGLFLTSSVAISIV